MVEHRDLLGLLVSRQNNVDRLVNVVSTTGCPIPSRRELLDGDPGVLGVMVEYFLWRFSPAVSLLVSRMLSAECAEESCQPIDSIRVMFKACASLFCYAPVLNLTEFMKPSNTSLAPSQYPCEPLPDILDWSVTIPSDVKDSISRRLECCISKLRLVSGFVIRCINLHTIWLSRSRHNLQQKQLNPVDEVYIKPWDLEKQLDEDEIESQILLTRLVSSGSFDSSKHIKHQEYEKQQSDLTHKIPNNRFAGYYPNLSVNPLILTTNSTITTIESNKQHQSASSPFVSAASNTPPVPQKSTSSNTTMTPIHITIQSTEISSPSETEKQQEINVSEKRKHPRPPYPLLIREGSVSTSGEVKVIQQDGVY